MNNHYIIPIFVPHLGCPHNCVFCNQRKITGMSTNIKPSNVIDIIDSHLKTFRDNSFVEVAFYGGSFTAIQEDIQSNLLEIPFQYKKQGLINNIRLSTRPDAIDENILKLLRKYTVDTIELGVQSLDSQVLIKSERGHTVDDVYKSSTLIKELGFKLGHQMMLGLPGDTRDISLATAKEVLKIKPDILRIYPTLVIKNTELEKMLHKGHYKPISLEDAIEISAIILMAFTIESIPVIRIGLQPTENIQLGKDVVAGPFHPAFRQLVEEQVFSLLFTEYIKRNKTDIVKKEILIKCSNSKTSVIAGQKGNNRKKLKYMLDFKKLKIIPEDLDDNKLILIRDDVESIINLKEEMELYLLNNPF